MSADEEINLDINNRLEIAEEVKKLFTNEIQKDYISKYTPYNDIINKTKDMNDTAFPQTESYKELKSKLSDNHEQKLLDLYDIVDITNTKKLTNNMCEVDDKNVTCYVGNVSVEQLSNGFRNGYENALRSLDEDSTINKPFGKGKLDLLEYMAIMASRDRSVINKYDKYLKHQIGKDALERDVFFINGEIILDTVKQNEVFNRTLRTMPNSDKTNIIALYILRELYDKTPYGKNTDKMYDILMTILPLLHQGLHGETQILFTEYINKIKKEIDDPNLHMLSIKTPENDDKINYKQYNNSNKYFNLIINENEISVYSVLYSKFVFAGDFPDILTNGHFFSVLHIDILNKQYEIKYFILDTKYKKEEYIPPKNFYSDDLSPNSNDFSTNDISTNKFDNLKEAVTENKLATSAGTLLTLGALSAIPLALLLGGKGKGKRKRTKRRLIKGKQRKNQRKTKRKYRTRRRKNYKKYTFKKK